MSEPSVTRSTNLTPSQARRRGFLQARVEADIAEIQLIEETAARALAKLEAQEAEARLRLAERTARLNAKLGIQSVDEGRTETDPEALAGGGSDAGESAV